MLVKAHDDNVIIIFAIGILINIKMIIMSLFSTIFFTESEPNGYELVGGIKLSLSR